MRPNFLNDTFYIESNDSLKSLQISKWLNNEARIPSLDDIITIGNTFQAEYYKENLLHSWLSNREEKLKEKNDLTADEIIKSCHLFVKDYYQASLVEFWLNIDGNNQNTAAIKQVLQHFNDDFRNHRFAEIWLENPANSPTAQSVKTIIDCLNNENNKIAFIVKWLSTVKPTPESDSIKIIIDSLTHESSKKEVVKKWLAHNPDVTAIKTIITSFQSNLDKIEIIKSWLENPQNNPSLEALLSLLENLTYINKNHILKFWLNQPQTQEKKSERLTQYQDYIAKKIQSKQPQGNATNGSGLLLYNTDRENVLRQELIDGQHVRPEQKSFLEFASIADLEMIYKYKNHKDEIHKMMTLLKNGEMELFLKEYSDYSKTPDAHYILLSAFCYSTDPILNLTEFATAFEFLSIAQDVGEGNYEICRREGNNALALGPEHINLSAEEMDKIPDKQQIAIKVKGKALDSNVESITNLLFAQMQGLGFSSAYRLNDDIICPSLSIIKAVLKDEDNSHVLKPVLAFTSRNDFIRDLFNNYSQIALLTPQTAEDTCVHGLRRKVKGTSVFRYIHDAAYHTALRIIQKFATNDKLKNIILSLIKMIDERAPLTVTTIALGFAYPRLAEGATQHDLETKMIMNLLGHYLDGNLGLPKEAANIEAYLYRSIDLVFKLDLDDSSVLDTDDKSNELTAIFSDETIAAAKENVRKLFRPVIENVVGLSQNVPAPPALSAH